MRLGRQTAAEELQALCQHSEAKEQVPLPRLEPVRVRDLGEDEKQYMGEQRGDLARGGPFVHQRQPEYISRGQDLVLRHAFERRSREGVFARWFQAADRIGGNGLSRLPLYRLEILQTL